MAKSKLTHPEHGLPIETAGKPVTTEPFEGGVRVENLSVPEGHDARVVYRELSAEEKRQQKADHTAGVAFRRADAMIFLRLGRDQMLRATDHFETLPNGEKLAGGKAKLDAWLKWRQALRDLPAKTKDPEAPVWPEPPEALSALVGQRGLFPKLDWTRYLS